MSRYLFGAAILVGIGLMGYLAVTNHLLANDDANDRDVEQLVAEYKRTSTTPESKDTQSLQTEEPAGAVGNASLENVSVHIETDPAGAEVEIDAEHVGTTPVTHLLEPGAYILSISKPDFAPIDTVLVFVEGGQQNFSFNLDGFGAAEESFARATPSNAAANRPNEAASPRNEATSARDEADLNTSRTGGAFETESRTAGDRSSLDEVRRSRRTAEIVISSHPAGASALVDGRYVGKTPVSAESIGSGTHRVQLEMDGFQPFEQSVRADVGETASVHGELVPRSGKLSVHVLPWGSIYIDGVLHEAHTDVRYTADVSAGEHTVVAVHPTLGSVTRKVSVRAGNSMSLTLDLEEQQ